MNRLAATLTVVLLGISLMTVGCQDKLKQQLAGMEQQYNESQLRNSDLQKSLADSEAEKGRLMAQLNQKDSQLTAAKAEIADLKAKGGQTAVPPGWQETATGAKISLGSDILFAPGSANLSRDGLLKIRQIASTIKTSYPAAQVRVFGFTDNDPIKKTAKLWQDNLDLSANRAMAVSRELEKLGISAERVETVAMGATHFVSSNATAAGKSKNRRVEIFVVK